jgi:hypothetical protein
LRILAKGLAPPKNFSQMRNLARLTTRNDLAPLKLS